MRGTVCAGPSRLAPRRDRSCNWAWPPGAQRHCDAVTLGDREYAIDSRKLYRLLCARGPMDLGCAGVDGVSEAKVQSRIVAGHIAPAAHHILPLPYPVGGEVNRRSHSVARTLRPSYQFQFHPMMMIGKDVSEKYRAVLDRADHYINLAIVEQIAERGSAAGHDLRQPSALYCQHLLEPAVAQVAEQQRPLAV